MPSGLLQESTRSSFLISICVLLTWSTSHPPPWLSHYSPQFKDGQRVEAYNLGSHSEQNEECPSVSSVLCSIQGPRRNTIYDSPNVCNNLTEPILRVSPGPSYKRRNGDSDRWASCLRSSRRKGRSPADPLHNPRPRAPAMDMNLTGMSERSFQV